MVPLRYAPPAVLVHQLQGPAQPLDEPPAVRHQARHLPGEVLDLPLQGRDLLGVLRPRPLVLRGQLPTGSRQPPFQRGHTAPSLASTASRQAVRPRSTADAPESQPATRNTARRPGRHGQGGDLPPSARREGLYRVRRARGRLPVRRLRQAPQRGDPDDSRRTEAPRPVRQVRASAAAAGVRRMRSPCNSSQRGLSSALLGVAGDVTRWGPSSNRSGRGPGAPPAD